MKHKLFSLLLALLMSITASVLFTSCGDDEEGGSSESALVGTWYYTDGDYIEEIIFKSDHTYIWRDKYSWESWEEAEIDKGRWTLKDGLVTVVCTEFDDTNQAVDYFIFDGKQLKYYDIDDWDEEVWRIYTKKKGSSGLGNETTGKEKDTGKHDYVDLGLPSGTLWATCNIGASKPEEYGSYFAWGETTGYFGGKTTFNWDTYKWYDVSEYTKYCTSSEHGTVDNKTKLEPSDDAAYVNWGLNWRMPSIEQFWELINASYTTTIWTTQNGVYGRKITSKSNGNSIFLPAAGCRSVGSLYNAGSHGYYWSRTLDTSYPSYARILSFDSSRVSASDYVTDRYRGLSVRPVRFSE